MLETIRKYFHKIAETLEVLMSLAVFAAVILALIALVPAFQEYLHDPSGSEGFMDLLQQILSIVVGLEFISMLCKKGSCTSFCSLYPSAVIGNNCDFRTNLLTEFNIFPAENALYHKRKP